MKGLAAVGDVLAGKYRVDKILGIGGMGMVVAATHLEIDQRVALKFMLPSSAESAESSMRFFREAKAAGRLNSEHVCRVMDVGRFDSGAPYIVMEYLQGENLGAVLRRRGPMRVAEAVDYILQGIEGLAEAHAHGIVHRDLKPDNLFIHKRNDGGSIVKVLDFGISKISAGGMSTKTGDIMGSPAYMAPEQMESTRSVDHRADVWSLGVVLYQLLVGKAPFSGETLPLLCLNVMNDPAPPMSETRADLPDGFEAVVMKCLAKEPGDRYADVGELAQALAPFGPKTASVSASRIKIVLRRPTRGSAVEISTDFATVPRDEIAGAPQAVAREATTFSATAGQSMATSKVERPSRWFPIAVLVGLGAAALVIVVLWRGGGGLDHGAKAASPPVAPPAPAHTGPIVEPIIEETRPSAHAVGEPAGAADPAAGSAAAVAPVANAVEEDEPRATPIRDKRKKPPRRNRPGARPAPTPAAAQGSAASEPPAKPAQGSAAPTEDEDDKWMHMTHDEKKQ